MFDKIKVTFVSMIFFFFRKIVNNNVIQYNTEKQFHCNSSDVTNDRKMSRKTILRNYYQKKV